MKKMYCAAATAAFALGCSLALVACGDDDNKKMDDSSVKSEQVASEAAWKSAFDLSGLTDFTIKFTQSSMGYEMYNIVYKRDGNKAHVKSSEDMIHDEEYYAVQSGAAYVYSKDDGSSKWVKNEYRHEINSTYWDTYKLFDSTVRQAGEADLGDDGEYNDTSFIAAHYAAFRYDSKSNAYVASFSRVQSESDIGAINISSNITLKIADGKLAYGKCVEKVKPQNASSNAPYAGGAENISEFKLYDKGKTSVTLPNGDSADAPTNPNNPDDPPIAVGSEVDAEGWESAVTFAGAESYKTVYTQNEGTITYISSGELSYTEIKDNVASFKTYCWRENGKGKIYQDNGDGSYTLQGEYSDEELKFQQVPEYIRYFMTSILSGQYSNFTYDAENKAYKANGLKAQMKGPYETTSYVLDAIVKFDGDKVAVCDLTAKSVNGGSVVPDQANILLVFSEYGKISLAKPDFGNGSGGNENDDPSKPSIAALVGEYGGGARLVISENGEADLHASNADYTFVIDDVSEPESGTLYFKAELYANGGAVGYAAGNYDGAREMLTLTVAVTDEEPTELTLYKK